MKTKIVTDFLGYISDFIDSAIFKELSFENVNSDIIRRCAFFFEGRTVDYINTGGIKKKSSHL